MAEDIPDRGASGSGPSLATRFFVATSLLVAAAIAASILITWIRGRQIADDSVGQELRQASSVQTAFQQQRLGQLRLIAYIIADNPYFAEYIRLAIEEGEALSILDQLDERRNDLDFDFAMVLDADGVVVARTDAPQREERENLVEDPLIQVALEDFEAAGVWSRDGQLYDVVAVPVATAGYLDGFLIVGYTLDEALGVELRRISGTEVAFVVSGSDGPKVTSTTLDASLADALGRRFRERPDLLSGAAGPSEEASTSTFELGQREWMTAIRRLEAVDGSPIGALVALSSLDEALAPFRRIQTFLVGIGSGILLLALVVSFALPRRILQPIRQLAAAARAAADGDYDQTIESRRTDEVGQLASAFSTLLADLREKRDMEVYISELARTLPDQEMETSAETVVPAGTLTPPSERELVVLGAELRETSRTPGSSELGAQQTLDRLARDLTPLSQAIRGAGGQVEKVLGRRILASFEGEDRARRALDAAAAISSGPSKTAQVLVSGRSAAGTLVLDRAPEYTLAGAPIEQLETLLRVARADSLLLSREVHELLGSTLRAAGIEARQVRSSVSEDPLFTLDPKALTPPELPDEVSSTRRLDATLPTSAQAPPPRAPGITTPVPGTLSGVGPGSVLGDRFEILSVLGAGGMGIVYKARDRSLQELVALKMLRQDVWNDASRLQGLKDELKLARKVSHRNVLRTFDFGEVDGIPFITMEYVRGITLKKLVAESGRLPLSAGLRLARQLCQGLEAAHREHVLHRDIKPENVILEHTGNAKLMDFGIAQPIQRRPSRDTQAPVVGTPYYLAPEQLEGREADVRSDLYSSGVVFYEIFTGELPYDFGRNLSEILGQKIREEPIPPSKRWPGIPAELESIILRCLARDPDQRYRDTAELQSALEHLRG